MKRPKRGGVFRAKTWLLLAGVLALLCVTMAVAITPENYNLKVGDVATENILASREVVDEEATAEQKRGARDAVAAVYSVDGTLTADIKQKLTEFFASVDTVRDTAAQLLQSYNDTHGQTGTTPTYESVLSDDEWQTLLSLWPIQTDKAALQTWLSMDESAYQTAAANTRALMDEALAKGIQETELENALQGLESNMDALDATREIKSLMKLAVSENLQANAFYDGTATEQAREKAEAAVADITYKKGQVIVRLGEIVTERHVEMLQSVGMLEGGIVWSVYIGAFLSALMTVGAFAIYLRSEEKIARDFRKTLMISLVMCFMVLLSAFLQRVDLQLVPVAFVAIVLSITVNRTSGIVMGLITTFICASTALASGLEGFAVLTFLTSGWICCYLAALAVSRYPTRSGIVAIGITAGSVGAVIQMVMALLTHANTKQMVFIMGMQVLSGVLSGVLCLGTTPIWESVFKALTPMKLMELCNPTNPLLKRLMYEAPGTYHHSVMVGNLAETAADAIGANGLLARVGAYYHDVGKLAAPLFFSENQPAGMKNPHDALPPIDSARLIMRHPHDSAAFLQEKGIAQPIIDIALQHHGSTPVSYFYHKAKEQDPDADIRDYRHTGGCPKTVEAAIVMLADCCEAATRAGGEDYQKIMRKIVRERVEDNQLDRVPLTFAQLDTIVDTFASVLRGAYHGRIQYIGNMEAPSDEGVQTKEKEADDQSDSN